MKLFSCARVREYVFLAALAIPCFSFGQTPLFIRGGDPSEIPEVEAAKGKYFDSGLPIPVTSIRRSSDMDPLTVFHYRGLNLIRLRTWVNPTKDGYGNVTPAGYCDKAHTLAMAKRAFQQGLKVAIDFHYSDWWADPGQQWTPAAWASLDHAALVNQVYTYTKDVISALVAQGTPPTIVQPGNEITAGMLWEDGRIYAADGQHWQQFTDLLKAGLQGVHDGAGAANIRTMIHIDRGGDNAGARWFFDNIAAYNVNFDIIGLSYYPWWHGPMSDMKANIDDLATRYSKDILIAETAYPFTMDFSTHNWGHVFSDPTQLIPGYPATPAGQSAFLQQIISLVKSVPNGHGLGVLYWAPAWISTPSAPSGWDNLALFDYNGNALPALKTLGKAQLTGFAPAP